MTVPLTGRQYQIGAGRYRAAVTELGAGLRELLFADQPVIAGYQPDELPPGGAGMLLTPWPNRIDGGRYVFCGTQYQLALTEPAHGNAIHGLTRWAAWAPGTRRSASGSSCSARIANGRNLAPSLSAAFSGSAGAWSPRWPSI